MVSLHASAVPAVHVHHEVTILQSVLLFSIHTHTSCESSFNLWEGDTFPFRKINLLFEGHLATKTVSTKQLI